MKPESTLILTLGGQPQIATFTLDLLLHKGYQIDQLILVYPASNERYQRSYEKVKQEFENGYYAEHDIKLLSYPIKLGRRTIDKISQPSEVAAVEATFRNLYKKMHDEYQSVHLSVSGGRRILSLVALSLAVVSLKSTDNIWHIYTPEDLIKEVKNGRKMHLPMDSGLELIEVPFVAWIHHIPYLQEFVEANISDMLINRYDKLSPEDKKMIEKVLSELTPRQLDVMGCLARGLKRAQIAQRFKISIGTTDDHIGQIKGKCRDVWFLHEKIFEDRLYQEQFAPYMMKKNYPQIQFDMD